MPPAAPSCHRTHRDAASMAAALWLGAVRRQYTGGSRRSHLQAKGTASGELRHRPQTVTSPSEQRSGVGGSSGGGGDTASGRGARGSPRGRKQSSQSGWKACGHCGGRSEQLLTRHCSPALGWLLGARTGWWTQCVCEQCKELATPHARLQHPQQRRGRLDAAGWRADVVATPEAGQVQWIICACGYVARVIRQELMHQNTADGQKSAVGRWSKHLLPLRRKRLHTLPATFRPPGGSRTTAYLRIPSCRFTIPAQGRPSVVHAISTPVAAADASKCCCRWLRFHVMSALPAGRLIVDSQDSRPSATCRQPASSIRSWPTFGSHIVG